MKDTTIEVFTDFLKTLLAGEILEVKFLKVDGTERKMKCTRDPVIIPMDQASKYPAEAHEVFDVVPVFDVELQEWRSFKPSRVITWREVGRDSL